MDETPELRHRVAELKAAGAKRHRLTRPATWPIWWWYGAAVIWSAVFTVGMFGLYAIQSGWHWPWMAVTFTAGAGSQIVMLWRRDRKRYGGPAQSGR